MSFELSAAGEVNEELTREIHLWWQESAQAAGIDVLGFDPDAPLGERIAWALSLGLVIGTIYTRFSSKRQHSTPDQVRTCVQEASRKGIYCPPELVSVDEAQRGYRTRRDGLNRMLMILKGRYATVLLVFKASRLYRQAFKGYQLIQQEVVEAGLRAISVTQGIDTADTKAWRMLFQVHGIVDDLVVEATADHVRAGLKGLFNRGFPVGALSVGYRPKKVPNAPLTNRGLTRTVPEIDLDAATRIVEHWKLILGGMPIHKGWRKWVAEGGPCDPRSTKGYMTYQAYRRMLSRNAYTGRWEFGRKRNDFSTKLDYTRQIEQPDSEVEVHLCEELRIISDEDFIAMQRLLAGLVKGPRGPRKHKERHLWDLVVDVFLCSVCNERFYTSGAAGKMMRCRKGYLCPCRSAVNRREAVSAICHQLCKLIHQDAELIEQIVCCAQELDSAGDDKLQTDISGLERKISAQSSRISDLYELAGQGNDDDRKEVMGRIRAAQSERAAARHELSRLQQAMSTMVATMTPEAVRQILSEFEELFMDAAAGNLGPEALDKAVMVFRRLVGGRVWVHVEKRLSRKRTNIKGVFQPHLIKGVREVTGQVHLDKESAPQVTVWLREPPRLDAIAERVHELIDIEHLSHRAAAKQLQIEGHNVNSGNVWYSYRRWYEMEGLPVPMLPYNNGNERESA
jgi:DNA invertase Pin-like site-specific DNA recombinase